MYLRIQLLIVLGLTALGCVGSIVLFLFFLWVAFDEPTWMRGYFVVALVINAIMLSLTARAFYEVRQKSDL